MKKIPISKHSHYALVDDDDYDELSKYKWFDMAGYAVRQVYEKGSGRSNRKVRTIRMHRLILGFPDGTIDHIDGNRCNNQKSNLRVCSPGENALNAKVRTDNTSGFKNVLWNKQKQKWQVKLHVGGYQRHCGFYNLLEEAIGAAHTFRLFYHKDFARHE